MMAGPIAKHLSTFSRLITSSTPCHETFPAVRTVIRHDNYFVRAFTHFFFQDDKILLRPANTVITRLPAAFKACTIGSIGATPTPPPAQITVPNFSIWVSLSEWAYYVSDIIAFIQLAERVKKSPTSCTTRVMVPFFRSEPAIVNGIRSPFRLHVR